MSRPPRKPRSITRDTRTGVQRVPGHVIAPRPADPGQPDLFRPALIQPCKPVLRDKLPAAPHWRYVIKHDGYRIQAHAIGGGVRLFTKGGHDWTDRMPGIRDALGAVRRSMVLDGEATSLGQDGIADFFALHAALARRSAPDAILFAFDLLWLDGEDMRGQPSQSAKRRLPD